MKLVVFACLLAVTSAAKLIGGRASQRSRGGQRVALNQRAQQQLLPLPQPIPLALPVQADRQPQFAQQPQADRQPQFTQQPQTDRQTQFSRQTQFGQQTQPAPLSPRRQFGQQPQVDQQPQVQTQPDRQPQFDRQPQLVREPQLDRQPQVDDATALEQRARQNIAIIRDDRQDSGDGNFNYVFESEDDISVNALGTRGTHGQSNVEGSYSFPLPDGTFAEVTYIADENGFRAESPLIPTPHPLPAHALEQIRIAEEQRALQPQEPNQQESFQIS